jgi:hypothetical protein
LAELAGQLPVVADPELLRFIAADAARDLKAGFKRGSFPLEEWRETALSQLALVEQEDAAVREEAAARLSSELRPHERLFGRKPDLIALAGGRTDAGGF